MQVDNFDTVLHCIVGGLQGPFFSHVKSAKSQSRHPLQKEKSIFLVFLPSNTGPRDAC